MVPIKAVLQFTSSNMVTWWRLQMIILIYKKKPNVDLCLPASLAITVVISFSFSLFFTMKIHDEIIDKINITTTRMAF